MKENKIHFVLILISYLVLGILISQIYIHHNKVKMMKDSINRLTLIEIITEKQFSLLVERIKLLEQQNNRSIVQNSQDH